ncbi:hypothetical protein BDD12DRAFT_807512 [Trichophaea hybrida]|nr:hypothetical protein BDD12DRAFT_807512 [Trichophaea hybrida]
MHFITSLLFLAITSTLTPALPHSKRQNTRITPSQVNKLYEGLPTNTVSDGWGEVSQTCNLRFDKPEIALGTLSFKVYDFIPTNGRTFDSKKASWNKKTGKTGKSLTTFKASKPPVVRIDMKDQVNLREGWGGTGSIQYGEINTSEPGKTVTTLVGFIMPSEDYTKRTCNLRFGKVTSATGTKTFKVFDFVPNNGLPTFSLG